MSFDETNPQTPQKKNGTGENDYQPFVSLHLL